MLHAMWLVLLELAPWLLVGTAVSAALHVLLPADFVQRHLSGKAGVVKAVLLGVPLPLCSCGVIPAGLGLHKDGASRGASVGFLISTPQTGVDSVLVSAAFLGWPFALFKVVAAAATGLVGGWLADAIEPSSSALVEKEQTARPRSLREFFSYADMLLSSIWRWLVFGILVSAVITVWVPADWSALLGQHAFLASLGALVIALPLYVCATASVPIAAAMVSAGLPTGAALVFLMAGPATNVATIGAVYRALGRKSLLVYLGTIIVGSVGLGTLFDFVIPQAVGAQASHAHTSIVASTSAIVLLLLFASFAIREGRDWWLGRRSASPPGERLGAEELKDEASTDLELGVEGMTCQGCSRRLTRALQDAPGVDSARVDLEHSRAFISGTVQRAALEKVIREAGFTPAP